MSKMPKGVLCLILLLTLFIGTLSVPALCGAYERIYTVTGEIRDIRNRVISLGNGKMLRPLHEVDIPDWAVPGAEATLSYMLRSTGDYYLEIVRPGEELKVKAALESIRIQGY